MEREKKRAPKQELESRTFRDGAIYLFRRSDYLKPVWQIRVKIPGTRGYIKQSSGTADEHDAYKIADIPLLPPHSIRPADLAGN